jgi:hypothetical protein
MNRQLETERQLDHGLLRGTFDRWWPDLNEAFQEICDRCAAETSTGYDWMYTFCDLNKRINPDIESKSILVVNPSPNLNLQSSLVREIVEANLARGINYKIMISDNTLGAEEMGIRSFFSSTPCQLELRRIPHDDFQSMAVTIYILLNYDPVDNPKLRAIFKLPVESGDYWIEANRDAARGFAMRFRDLLNKHKDASSVCDQGVQVPSP